MVSAHTFEYNAASLHDRRQGNIVTIATVAMTIIRILFPTAETNLDNGRGVLKT
jgi:hypothetical protein